MATGKGTSGFICHAFNLVAGQGSNELVIHDTAETIDSKFKKEGADRLSATVEDKHVEEAEHPIHLHLMEPCSDGSPRT
jgi:SHS2 domain-containing protein